LDITDQLRALTT